MMIQIIGRLGADPQVRYTPSNQKVTSFNLAVNVYQGGREETVWWRVSVWGDRFDKMMNYVKKGSCVIVTGTMKKPELWTNRDGNQQVSLDMTAEMINFVPSSKAENQQSNQGVQSNQQDMAFSSEPAQSVMATADTGAQAENVDDDLPF